MSSVKSVKKAIQKDFETFLKGVDFTRFGIRKFEGEILREFDGLEKTAKTFRELFDEQMKAWKNGDYAKSDDILDSKYVRFDEGERSQK